MKNEFVNKFTNVLKLQISGKNIERYLKRLMKNKIELLEIIKIDNKNIYLKIYEKDYSKVVELNSVYEIKIIDIYGIKKIKKFMKLNQYLLFFIMLGIILLIFLSHIIFKVEVIHNSEKLRTLITKELEKYDIKKYKLIKSYNEIKIIKEKILNKYNDQIEWMEIEQKGTKYIIRVEERIQNKKEPIYIKQHIISNSNAIISDIKAQSGQIVRNVNDYVKKGDVIISGDITLNDEVKNQVMAKGTVYGEVWYNVTTKFPIHYYKKIKTNQKNKVLVLNIFNKRVELFNFNKYKDKKIEKTKLISNNLFPISLSFEKQTKLKIIDKIYLENEALDEALKHTRRKIEKDLTEKEKIIDIKKLKVTENNSTIEIEMFVTVYKNITATKVVEENNV